MVSSICFKGYKCQRDILDIHCDGRRIPRTGIKCEDRSLQMYTMPMYMYNNDFHFLKTLIQVLTSKNLGRLRNRSGKYENMKGLVFYV